MKKGTEPVVENLKMLDNFLTTLDKKKDMINSEIKHIKTTKDIICKENDICPVCYGTGTVYDEKARDNDNDCYSKSSDYEIECKRCNGTGNYEK